MKKYDVFIVRIYPFLAYLYLGLTILNAYNGVSLSVYNNLFTTSSFAAFSMFLISLSNTKYHCSYNRAMYIMLMIVPLINFIDAKYCIFEEAETQLLVLSSLWFVTAIITSILALNHFLFKRIRKAWNYLMKTS